MGSHKDFLIKVASSNASMEELLSKINSINKNKGTVVQIFDPGRIINKIHILGAYIDAEESFKGKTNISKSKSLEMLLFVAMTNQISEAIKTVGAKNSKEFILFANNRAAFNRLAPLISHSRDLARSKKLQAEIARGFGIYSKDSLIQFVLQKMTISRISD